MIARVLKLLSVSYLVGYSMLDYLNDNLVVNPLSTKLCLYCAICILITGLYTAGSVKPSTMGKKAKFWRFIIYGLKIPLYLTLSPLLEKFTNYNPKKKYVLFPCIILIFLSVYAKTYREKVLNNKIKKK